jgi:prephenate dehydrogenase
LLAVKIETIGLIGFGRFGRMAYQYLRHDKALRVFDADSRKVSDVPEASSWEETLTCDLLILSIPISAMPAVCSRMSHSLGPNQVVLDTCSVKLLPTRAMLAAFPPETQIVGTHPLFGPDSGKDGIVGLRIALCPVRVDPDVYAGIRRYLESLRLVIIEVSPEEHDKQIAETQAVFHLIAQAIKRLGWGGQAISTPGPEVFYRLVRTVQNDTEQLFLDLERQNPHAARCRRLFIETILDLDRELSAG